MLPASYWITAIVTVAAVGACVALHYEGLRFISRHLPMPERRHRARIVLMILSLVTMHVMEIWVFGFTYWMLLANEGFGALVGGGPSLVDCVYYSASVFTTLGFGDIVPTGAIRFTTGTEAVTGLTLITWSASFTFLFMQRSWGFARD